MASTLLLGLYSLIISIIAFVVHLIVKAKKTKPKNKLKVGVIPHRIHTDISQYGSYF